MKMKNLLRYARPAESWEKGMPLGNGRLGAMMLGNLAKEHIWLNEDTLWSGKPGNYNDPEVYSHLQKVRELIFQKRFKEGDEIINQHMVGVWNESYMPMADLEFTIPELNDGLEFYERTLDLGNAVSQVLAEKNGRHYSCRGFCSYPDQVFLVRLACEEGFKEGIQISLSSQLHHWTETGEDQIWLTGWCPTRVEPDYYPSENPIRYDTYDDTPAIKYAVGLQIRTDGTVKASEEGITVSDCSAAEILLTSANSFVSFDQEPKAEFKHKAKERLRKAVMFSYDELSERHTEDHKQLFERVEIDLGHTENEELYMEERMKGLYEGEEDPELLCTAFQFGRYLMIAGSRAGSQALNLQGIWNDSIRPRWSSNYTVNINLQMNYWAAETGNLSECTEPLWKFIEETARAGEETAKINYHCRGWAAHHNIDLWRHTTAVGSRKKDTDVLPWSFWLMSGGWFCQHIWEHYAFTGDQSYLRDYAYQLMKSCALFYLDFLAEHDGKLVTCPSSSPENLFVYDGECHGMYYSCTMDNQILRELFSNYLRAEEALGYPDAVSAEEVRQALRRIPDDQIGKNGQIQEWYEDFEENDPEHRHLSMLYGLYPGNEITPDASPQLAAAARIALERRGNKSTPWSRAWKIGIYARLGDGEQAAEQLRQFLQLTESNEISYDNGGVFSNLFCARPLQIDGACGFTAGMAEMLVQSHTEEIQYLPAIPSKWKNGYVRGLRIRGNQEIEIEWKDGNIVKAEKRP